MVVCDLLMRLLLNRHQTSQGPGTSTVECVLGPMCANKLEPRSGWQNPQNGQRPFWFYGESIRINGDLHL